MIPQYRCRCHLTSTARRYLVVIAAAVLPAAAAQGGQDANEQLRELFHSEWERQLRDNPIRASYFGDPRYNDRWPDLSLDAIEQRQAADREALDRLLEIERDELPAGERLNYDLFERQTRNRIAGHRFRDFLIPLDHRGGAQTLDELTEVVSFAAEQDYRDWVARLEGLDEYLAQTTRLMRQGMAENWVHPRIIMERVPAQIRTQITADPRDSPFYKPFRDLPESIDEATGRSLQKRAARVIAEQVVPAYQAFLTFFTDEYLPACRDQVAARWLPEGRDYYRHNVRHHTTTDLSPEDIHAIGLREVERIRREMQAVIDDVGFDGDFAAFLEYLRTDPQFYFDNPDDLYKEYLAVSKRLDPELVKLFGKLPRLPYGVRPIPEAIAPDTTTAYYQPPPADGSRAGYYYVNLHKPEVRPTYEIEVLSVHEAVPGHHLQIALAMELDDLPAFRRFARHTAFVEGWGLYAERLGYDMGLYQDPYSRFGQLTYDMWRAVRLVVDTGMHHEGWSRRRAIDYFLANAAKTEHDIVNEIDRYIAWPGQALAYKIGQLKILELREQAERTLGNAFDIKAFHDAVLGAGAVPLDILERHMEQWLEVQRRGTASSSG